MVMAASSKESMASSDVDQWPHLARSRSSMPMALAFLSVFLVYESVRVSLSLFRSSRKRRFSRVFSFFMKMALMFFLELSTHSDFFVADATVCMGLVGVRKILLGRSGFATESVHTYAEFVHFVN